MCAWNSFKSDNKADLGHQWHLVVTRGNVHTPQQCSSVVCFLWFWAHVLHSSADLMCCMLSSLDLWDLSCSKPGERCQSCQSKLVTGGVKPDPCRPTGWARSTQHTKTIHSARDVEQTCSILNLSTRARNSLLPCLFEGREENGTNSQHPVYHSARVWTQTFRGCSHLCKSSTFLRGTDIFIERSWVSTTVNWEIEAMD